MDKKTRQKHLTYLDQEELLMDHQTVNRSLMISSKLQGNTESRSQLIVDSLLGSFEMKQKKMQKVAELSSYEKRCLSLSQAMICNQGVLALEEPFRGTEREEANVIVNALKQEARLGSTIISSVGSVSNEILDSFDRIIVLSQNGIVYNGKHKDAAEFDKILSQSNCMNPITYSKSENDVIGS